MQQVVADASEHTNEEWTRQMSDKVARILRCTHQRESHNWSMLVATRACVSYLEGVAPREDLLLSRD